VENGAPIPISSTIDVVEPDNGIITSAQIAFTSGFVPTEDLLEFTDQNNITGSFNTSTGVLNLSGAASATDYQNAIRSVTYHNLDDNPATTPRIVEIVVNDGGANSNTVNRTVMVQMLPDSPTVQLSPIVNSLTENTLIDTTIDVAAITVTDPDGGPNTLSLSGTHASLFQITADRLQLKAGVSLDSETLSHLDVVVEVDDVTIGPLVS